MTNYTLGLDIGITSVGYGLIDTDTKSVIDAGVRLFPEANVENNEGRRSQRGARRLKRRRIHRLERVKRLLSNYHLMEESNPPHSTNPYQIRVKGLREELSKAELAVALLHIAKRRGIDNMSVDAEDDAPSDGVSTKDVLAKNANELSHKYVCELQLDRLLAEGKVRGEQNRFQTKDLIEEVKQLLTTQKNYHTFDDEFINHYIKLVQQRRAYYEGPGEPSPYGWGGNLKEWYEMLMGHCTYFPDELRSVKYAYSADLFNALNDLNNLVIQRDGVPYLEYFEKFHIIENVFKQKKTPTLKQIAKEIDVTPEDIKGYRVTKSGKSEFTKFKIYHDLKDILTHKEYLEDNDLMDEIAKILTIYQDSESIKEELEKLTELFTEEEKEAISQLSSYTGTHRLSLKCINYVLPDLWKTPYNQMELFTQLNLKPKKVELKNQNHIPTEIVDEFILSPVVRRSFIQSIKVVDAVIQKYGQPTDIIIELARENNSKEQRQFINKLQKQHDQTRHRIEEIMKQYNNENAKYLFEKIKLHDMQEGKCLYSLKDIPLEDLLRNPYHYEVDHIIPRSVAFDNSLNNKVLVRQEENSKKGARTPYQYLNSSDAVISYNQFKQHVLNLSKSKDRMSKKKRDYLLEERDINKFEVQKEFINRNLVDTRYTTRELANFLKTYFKINNIDTKVKTINGGFTNYLRKVWRFSKERNHGYKHHAEDALVIANANFLFKQHKALKEAEKVLNNPASKDESAIDVFNDNQYKELMAKNSVVDEIKDFKDFKFSHRVDKKPNRQLLNDTLYSTRNIDNHDYIVQKLTNIYDKDNKEVKKIVSEKPEKLLMYQHDPKTFKKLQTVMDQYAEEKNPLAKYYEEHGEYLKKYAKKGNGPAIKSLKYIGKKVNAHFDVTDKYPNPKNKLVKLSLKSFRFDIYKGESGYKMLGLSYLDVEKKDAYYRIPSEYYEELKKKKKINEGDEFIGSFYTNDLIKVNGEKYRVIGVNNSDRNIIEVDMPDIRYREYLELNNKKGTPRIFITIGKKINTIEKYSTDILGNLYKNERPKKPQLIFKKGVE
ncbi:type II CRISPR RNA-guided endonuclease Cas9 [Staphylococcus pettenkoferi]|uniref:CRISPR-associated endonuclease Cas9 n=1 Tax=Staphylococcus pettenkoferi TaxID=170573 RepID=A0A9Q4GYX3_9STAP|nr:type II CRISPR RNA-guided endonuclease Cas9 [Staphylococcus pettenkoferi]MCY1569351.1 type II CRISPR RNA-guided endonuclease Cas9 [Staphylococcus pettenkoferi]MCY1576098.1 type II CRISPR RNA-guided endonuclease Cas9 [Staphylococcus pettenkoferi]MCY1593890.1 type II CRISPR RNA-guided endonuclease Cas9 [Staphylococcus pettenkoferi]MCY1617511.1 type II CRISPR RNA-guided endonuclease Cas9 [Staphylococcus pettenkoferi]